MNKDSRLKEMTEELCKGDAPEEIIGRHLSRKTVRRSGSLREKIQAVRSEENRLQEKYKDARFGTAVFQELDEQCGGDIAEQFRRISDLKYMIGIRNLEAAGEELERQGMDLSFIREALEKTHHVEKEMAEAAEEKELEALRAELVSVLPDEREKMKRVIGQTAREEGWEELLEAASGAAEQITDREREDLSVLAAALLLEQRPELSDEEAAAAAALAVAHGEGRRWIYYVLTAIPVASGGVMAGFAALLLAPPAGILEAAGAALFLGSSAVLGVLVLLAAGKGAYDAVAALIPRVQRLWEKCLPHIRKTADRVKTAVAQMFGVVADRVFRPVIFWVQNTAVPAVRKTVVCPLKRRLESLLNWFGEKKEQITEFIRKSGMREDQEAGQEESWPYEAEEEDAFETEEAFFDPEDEDAGEETGGDVSEDEEENGNVNDWEPSFGV